MNRLSSLCRDVYRRTRISSYLRGLESSPRHEPQVRKQHTSSAGSKAQGLHARVQTRSRKLSEMVLVDYTSPHCTLASRGPRTLESFLNWFGRNYTGCMPNMTLFSRLIALSYPFPFGTPSHFRERSFFKRRSNTAQYCNPPITIHFAITFKLDVEILEQMQNGGVEVVESAIRELGIHLLEPGHSHNIGNGDIHTASLQADGVNACKNARRQVLHWQTYLGRMGAGHPLLQTILKRCSIPRDMNKFAIRTKVGLCCADTSFGCTPTAGQWPCRLP